MNFLSAKLLNPEMLPATKGFCSSLENAFESKYLMKSIEDEILEALFSFLRILMLFFVF